ncbi:MAG: NAD(P)-dependent alcohol dehydrogenase [Terrimesophilobacter sp.]
MTDPSETARGPNSGGGARIPAKMLAVVARRYGGSEVLAIESVPVPAPAPGQLLVSVRASSANALDWHFLSGTPYFMRLIAGLWKPKRLIQGADVAGIVEAVGTGVGGFHIGDAVFGESGGGGFARYATVDAADVVALPQGVNFAAAGATPVAGLTALQGLRTHGALRAGDRVLINGAAGGVGTFAIQIAQALGAGEITAVCSTNNVDQARALGATRVIDYCRDDFVTAAGEYDVILDMVGNKTATEILSILASRGRYVAVSGPMTNRWLGPLPHLVRTRFAFRRAQPSFHQFTAAATAEDLTFLAELLASGQLVPAVDRIVGLDGVAEAMDQISTGHGPGKVVVVPGPALT